MSTVLRIEYLRPSSGDEGSNPRTLGGATLQVTATATAANAQPVVVGQYSDTSVPVKVTAFGGPVYIDIAAMPDPTTATKSLVSPGQPACFRASNGWKISAVAASDLVV